MKTLAVAGAALTVQHSEAMDVLAQTFTNAGGGKVDLVAVMGGEPEIMFRRAIAEMGGMKAFIKPGQKVVVKPNIGWDKVPALAGNTNPKLVAEIIKQCFAAGAKEVTVFDHTCDDWQKGYNNSGIEAAAKAAQAHTDWQGVVQFEDVSFRYPGADSDALEHISFTAKPGETTAIIGSTGCGKSTLLNLIPRFYDVTGGKVTVDGIDVREMPQAQLHDLLGYVPQKGVLFSGTIDSNLKFGGEDITDAQVHKAAAIAQATDFIEAKPEGYQSPIAQGGSNVSGGQKQRLSIARAIAKDPKVYLFDDSFSALDYKTDVTLRRALKAQTDNATVIIVAQRISTVLHANQILVLDEGRLVGKGTHAQLMVSCPEYQEIARSQLSQKELALDTLNTEKEGE